MLLERDLDVIRRGIEEGRRTFANTLKYVLIDDERQPRQHGQHGGGVAVPAVPAAARRPDPAQQLPVRHSGDRARRRQRRSASWSNVRGAGTSASSAASWSIFGLLSSLFDFLTFGAAARTVFQRAPELFRTGWFVESLLTELVIALVVRTRRPFFRSRPGALLLVSTLVLVVVTFAIPFLPFASLLGFVPLSPVLLATIAVVTLAYVAATELTKGWFYRAHL